MNKRDHSYLIGNQFAKGNKPNQTAFKKGQVPWNKGTKGLIKANKGSWTKGQEGRNWQPVGTISLRVDRNGTQRRWIKIKSPNIWIVYARYLWLQAGRKLKQGLCLHHKNNNSLDDRLNNLMLVTRSEHPKLHNRWNTKNKKL